MKSVHIGVDVSKEKLDVYIPATKEGASPTTMEVDNNTEGFRKLRELARKAKAEGLTDAEIEERAVLRQEYLNAVMSNARAVLENTYIVDEKGNKRKLQGKGEPEE